MILFPEFAGWCKGSTLVAVNPKAEKDYLFITICCKWDVEHTWALGSHSSLLPHKMLLHHRLEKNAYHQYWGLLLLQILEGIFLNLCWDFWCHNFLHFRVQVLFLQPHWQSYSTQEFHLESTYNYDLSEKLDVLSLFIFLSFFFLLHSFISFHIVMTGLYSVSWMH